MKHKPVLRQIRVVIEFLCVIFLLLIAMIPFIFSVRQQMRANALDRSGIFTEATILGKRTYTSTSGGGPGGSPTESTSYLVKYGFEVAGKQIIREVSSRKLYNDVAEYDQIQIRYLPKDPSINEIKDSNHYQNQAPKLRYFGTAIIIIPLLIALLRLPKWFKFYKFKRLPKASVQAQTTDLKVVSSNDGKGGTSHKYYVTYSFETVEGNGSFEFIETVNKRLYRQIRIGTRLTVEYVIANPRLAHSSLPIIDNDF